MKTNVTAKMNERREEMRKRGAELLNHAFETGKGVYELAHGEFAEILTDLARRREQFEKDGLAFFEKMMKRQQVDLKEVEVKILAAVDAIISKLNESFVSRFGVIEKAVAKAESRIKELEAKLRPAEGQLPVADYDDLNVKEVVEKLDTLGREDVKKLRDYEVAHKARSMVLDAMDRKLT